MVTRKSIAQAAGVAESTVSNVINGSKYVSDELRERVLLAISQNDYSPNAIARSLVTKVTKHVGILVSDILNPYYSEIAEGMEEVAHQNGYMVSLCLAHEDTDKYLESIISRRMDGLFVMAEGLTRERLFKLHRQGIALIAHSVDFASDISIDYRAVVTSLMEHLIHLGHRKIAIVNAEPLDDENTRYAGYRDTLKKHGVPMYPEFVLEVERSLSPNYYAGYEAMKKILMLKRRATAVFLANDVLAVGAIKAVREAGLRVPEDISIAGCDNIHLTEYSFPTLTTIHTPKREIGQHAMNLLLDQINEKKYAIIPLKLELVIRESTGPVRR